MYFNQPRKCIHNIYIREQEISATSLRCLAIWFMQKICQTIFVCPICESRLKLYILYRFVVTCVLQIEYINFVEITRIDLAIYVSVCAYTRACGKSAKYRSNSYICVNKQSVSFVKWFCCVHMMCIYTVVDNRKTNIEFVTWKIEFFFLHCHYNVSIPDVVL